MRGENKSTFLIGNFRQSLTTQYFGAPKKSHCIHGYLRCLSTKPWCSETQSSLIIYSSNKYLLSLHYAPGNVVGWKVHPVWMRRPEYKCSFCCCSVAKSYPALCNPMDCSMPGSLSFTVSQSLVKLISIESVMPFNHLVLCHPLILLPSNFTRIRVFFNELALHIRWPKY